MAVRIRFDAQHNAEQPTLVLATKNGRLLGKLPAHNMQFKDTMNSYSELRFDVYKKGIIQYDHIRAAIGSTPPKLTMTQRAYCFDYDLICETFGISLWTAPDQSDSDEPF